MFAANTYFIRLATYEDAMSLSRLAEFDARRALLAPALIGYINGRPAAAISVSERRIVTDPSLRTDHLVACLRVRANALRAYEATPSLPARMLAALSLTDQSTGAQGIRPLKRRSSTGKAAGKNHRRWRPGRAIRMRSAA